MKRQKRQNFTKIAVTALGLPLTLAGQTWSAPAQTDAPGTWASGVPAPDSTVATPASVLGWTPGDDYKLDSWDQVTRFYERLAATSDRVQVVHAGKTTEGRDYLIVYISSANNLKNLKRLQEINLQITDPRKIKGGDAEATRLIAQGKTVVALTYGVHSTEVASYLGGQSVAYRLASQNDPETRRILDNTVIILVPARNPDGVDIVKTAYDKRLAEAGSDSGGGPRGGAILINKYIGHDDNRDFVGATQPETKIELADVYNAWHPQIVHDVHQQGEFGPRLTLPPYTAPVEPNIPRAIVQQYNDLGHEIAQDLHAQGFQGVQTGGSAGGEGYDDWSPLRHYVHFHNAVRILEESASADIASPVTVPPDRVPAAASANLLDPWPGGKWTVGDGVKLVQATTFSLLDHAAEQREYYLRTSYQIAKDAVRPRNAGEKAAYLIPDAPNRSVLLSTLDKGGVGIRFLTQDLASGGITYPKGTGVVRLDQPYGGYANALLSKQDYPNLLGADGSPIRPYDVTAHTISLLYDVPAVPINGPFTAKTTAPQPIPEAPAKISSAFTVPPSVRIGLFKSNTQDQGWVRFVLDLNGVKYTEVDDTEIQAGHLDAKYDALLFATPIGGAGRGGRAFGGGAGRAGSGGGLGPQGETALKDFVSQGGTLIALNQASDGFIPLFSLPLQDITQGLGRADYFSPGEILDTEVETTSRLAKGVAAHSIVWAQNLPVFAPTDAAQSGQIDIVAHYPTQSDPLLSGWLLGGDSIKGKAALVDAKYGKGDVILFGFAPLYRGLSLATYPFLFNAIADAAQNRTATVDHTVAAK